MLIAKIEEAASDCQASRFLGFFSEENRGLDFGLAVRSWRVHRKLSQLDLALACGSSQRHISFLESGRANPSRQMVGQLSEALEVPRRDRNHLYVAAGFAPIYGAGSLNDPQLAVIKQRLTASLEDHLPLPAIIIDRDYNVVISNHVFDSLIDLFGEPNELWGVRSKSAERNLLRLVFHPSGLRHAIKNFTDIAPVIMQRVCGEALKTGRHPSDVMSLFPDLPESIESFICKISEQNTQVMPFILVNKTRTIKFFTVISELRLPGDGVGDELSIETYYPLDTETEKLFHHLHNTHLECVENNA